MTDYFNPNMEDFSQFKEDTGNVNLVDIKS